MPAFSTLLKASALGRAVVVLALGVAASVGYAAANRPNILLIVSDDQGYGDFSCFGNQRLDTPNLDRLKSESVWLERFYVSPLCSPTRAALMTGRHQFRTGVWDTWGSRGNLASDEVTLAEHLAAAGYDTGHFGKWHLGTNYPFRPQDQGFATTVDTFYPLYRDRLNPQFAVNGVVGEPRGRFIDDVIADEAVRFIAQRRDRPFFAYVGFFMPHTYPRKQVPDAYVRPFEQYPELLPGDREIYGMVANLDKNVGRVLAALRAHGFEENTLVIFMSDNGPSFPAPVGPRASSIRYNFGLRGAKGTVYEGGIRVPAFVRWKGRIAPGTVTAPVVVHDVLPTILEAIGMSPDEDRLDGRSFLPLLAGEGPQAGERFLFQQQQPQRSGLTPQLYENACVIGDRFKLVFPSANRAPELYDLIADRGETRDISGANAEVVATMKAAYEAWYESVRSSRNFEPPRTRVGTAAQPAMNVTASWLDGHYGFPLEVGVSGTYRIELRALRSPARRLAVRDMRTMRLWPMKPVEGASANTVVSIPWRAGELIDLQPVYIGVETGVPDREKQLEPLIPHVPLGVNELPFDTMAIELEAALP